MVFFDIGLDKCVKCSICVEHCPVYRVDSKFPGPKQAGPDSQRFRHHHEIWQEEWLFSCSHCTLCETACPSEVPIASMILEAQNRQIEINGKKPSNFLLSSPDSLGKMATIFPAFVNFIMKLHLTRFSMEKIFGIDEKLPFPEYKKISFKPKKKKSETLKRKVLYFHGCTIGYNEPDIGKLLISILEKLDVEVIIPPQSCCGLPALCNGNKNKAKRLAEKQIQTFSRLEWKDLPIIYNCTSCGHTMANEWGNLVSDEIDFLSFSNRLYDIHEFIYDILQEKKDISWKPVHKKLAYHIPCHLRSLGIGLPAAKILRIIPGIEINILNTGCCGLSGTYGYKPGHAKNSRLIGSEVAQAIKKISPEQIVTDCGSCRLQLHSLTGTETTDPLKIIAASLL